LGGLRTPARRTRRQALAAGVLAGALAVSVAACGSSESSSDAGGETEASYPVRIVTAEFPAEQRLGETTLLRLGVRNAGKKTIPALTVTISVGGEEGRDSSLPFGYRDPQPGIAQPDRPVWALAAAYPQLNGSSERSGAETASPKTFDFGPLKAGKTAEAVWKLSAVKTGRYEVFYEVGGGLGGKAKAETAPGTAAGGSFVTRISEETPDTEVTDSGEVVEIEKKDSGK
jgi:hypothetical protein